MSKRPDEQLDVGRREFLIRSGRYLGAAMFAGGLGPSLPFSSRIQPAQPGRPQGFQLHPYYRSSRPIDAALLKLNPQEDDFATERYAAAIEPLLQRWANATLESPTAGSKALASMLATEFRGTSHSPTSRTTLRSDRWLEATRLRFPTEITLDASAFPRDWEASLKEYERLEVFECQITKVKARTGGDKPDSVMTQVRWELVGEGKGFFREQRIGDWEIEWVRERSASAEDYRITSWKSLGEERSRATFQSFLDIAPAALGINNSFAEQLGHGADYWRTILDAASGIDIYGHNGVSVGDIDNDGLDDIYVCQAGGLPNRLYRNRGDGTFEDITESSGLGLLENTACALIVDVDNEGRQDVIVVCASGPQLFRNEGRGKFRQQPNAFRFQTQPQGTFTGAAVADYDRDGWLDIYFCLYVYYEGAEQYKYPLPYYDAENGPPNFLFKNNRDGTFRDVTREAGLSSGNTRYSFCCGWNDYDRDGWPDLYVVNDFGRKNLYRNNRDGTFTDVSKAAGVEDTGAGMSVCWLDYDNDGAQDLYVANMWTAAGLRLTEDPAFQESASPAIHALYQKHAMGNSLFHNRGVGAFEDKTMPAAVGFGRWSWSSDSWDFDHDGFADIYVTNGMVSGPSRQDLNSFFWRQIVAKSPLDATPTPAYEQGWTAINELLRTDGTWSGYERNVFYANNRNGTFSDVSGALGLDCLEDGRTFALSDFDADGRVEVFLKNRNAPQLRILKNVMRDLPPAIAFRLRGTKSNRDAIGAVITVHSQERQQSRALEAGSGFLAQHSKEVLFGLGDCGPTVRATILWPSGLVQDLRDLPPGHRIFVEEGSASPRIEPFAPAQAEHRPAPTTQTETLPERVECWLLAPIVAPNFTLLDAQSRQHRLADHKGSPMVLHFWTSQSESSAEQLKALGKLSARCFAIDVSERRAVASTVSNNQSVQVLFGDADVGAIYNILWSYLFDRHRDLPLPATFLLNPAHEIEKVYTGPVSAETIERDLRSSPKNVAERMAKALPFPGIMEDPDFHRNYLSYGSQYYQRGYFEQAQAFFERALSDDPQSAEALYGVGSSMLQLGKVSDAREKFEAATRAKASFPDTLPNSWNNLGLLATREGHIEQAADLFQRALEVNPNHLVALDNLGNAYRQMRRWPEAEKVFQHAAKIAPDDAEAHYGLGMVYAQTGRNDLALEQLQSALAIRPDYPEALNNLGVLFLNLHRVDDAITAFRRCIAAVPKFEQSYLNLARLLGLQGKSSEARTVLQQLLVQHPDNNQARKMLEQMQ